MNETAVRFTNDDLNLFCAASGDRNPLHLSAAYASRTSYGQQVVFGALGAVACLGKIPFTPDIGVKRVVADFFRPLFLNVNYEVRCAEQSGSWVVRLLDDGIPHLALSVTTTGPAEPGPRTGTNRALFERVEAADLADADIHAGVKLSGRYCCDPSALQQLKMRWGVQAEDSPVEALLWASYLIGMELPGKSALFSRFAIELTPDSASGPLVYEASVRSVDSRLNQIRIDVSVLRGDKPFGSGECRSFFRPGVPASADDIGHLLEPSSAMAGKVALVTGASRGLGRALAKFLASQGARVVGLSRSESDQPSSGIEFVRADAGKLSSLTAVREHIQANYGRLDFLICSAFPAILPLRMGTNSLERIQTYLQEGSALVLAPFCCFLEMLNEAGGCAVVISSEAVEQPPKEWPHYVAAKNAVEAYAAIAPLQYPQISSLVVRPDKLLTEMTNTPLGRRNASRPEYIAADIVRRLLAPPPAGTSEMLKRSQMAQAG